MEIAKYLCFFMLIFTFFILKIVLCNGVPEAAVAGNGIKFNYNRLIVGGIPAKRGELPWVVGIWWKNGFAAFGKNNRPFCGGSLVGKRWVLTAAHCLTGANSYKSLEVVAGDHNVSKTDVEEQRLSVCGMKIHELYPKTKRHDIALIELCNDVTYTKFIQPISMAYKTYTMSSRSAVTVAGWGRVKEGGKFRVTVLRKVTVKTIPVSICRKSYGWISEAQICAGIENVGGKDSCQGDSGGPLWHKKKGKTYQVGIVSSGRGCARPNAPGIYTSVAYYRDWIAENMSKKKFNSDDPPITMPPISVPIDFELPIDPIELPAFPDGGILCTLMPLLCPSKTNEDNMESLVSDLIEKKLF